MSIREQLRDAAATLLGISAYQKPRHGYGLELDDDVVEAVREALGGQLQPLVRTRLRWYLADLETAQANADSGNLTMCAQLYRAMRRDAVLSGLMSARVSGLMRLPRKFYGNAEIAEELRSKKTLPGAKEDDNNRSVFDEMFPPSEVKLLGADGVALGVGVAELVPVPGRDYPVMIRLDPEFLTYRWVENRWYFSSVAGLLPITPGDGRWILHTPGGRMSPWQFGIWPALGQSFINKQHALLHRANYSSKLANPARVAYAPLGASQVQREGLMRRLMAWGVNTVFEMPPGWEAKILESNGRGWETFQREIDTSDKEYMIAIAGQLLTTTGGEGFSNADAGRAIQHDLVKDDGDGLAYTLNTQGIPAYIAGTRGVDEVERMLTFLEWDTSTPKELEAESRTMQNLGNALTQLDAVLAAHNVEIDVLQLFTRYGIPAKKAAAGALRPVVAPKGAPKLEGDRAAALARHLETVPGEVREAVVSALLAA